VPRTNIKASHYKTLPYIIIFSILCAPTRRLSSNRFSTQTCPGWAYESDIRVNCAPTIQCMPRQYSNVPLVLIRSIESAIRLNTTLYVIIGAPTIKVLAPTVFMRASLVNFILNYNRLKTNMFTESLSA
jgi:hypothetical protein